MADSSIKKQLASNTLWNALERFSIMGIQLTCTFVLARFLTPDDFGLVGMLVVFTTIGNTLIDSGFSQALIREKEINNIEYSSVFYFNIFISIIIYITLYFSSGWIAIFYNQNQLESISKITFLIIPINALYLVQNTILIRKLAFRKLCLISLAASLSSGLCAIILVFYFQNVWVLVIQNVLTYAFKCILLWMTSSWQPILRFSLVSIQKYFKFSKNLLVSGLIGNIFNNIYPILIGRCYTPSDLGFYSQADRMKNVVSSSSTTVIQSVTYPILSQVNNKKDGNLREAYRKIITITVIFVGCIMALLTGIGTDLFELLMGDSAWRISGIYLIFLNIVGALHPLHAINQNILMVKGKGKSLLYLEFFRRVIMILILFITVRFNILIFIFGQVIYSILLLFLNLYICGKPINYTIREQLTDVLPIFARQVIMALSALGIGYLLSEHTITIRLLCSFTAELFIGFLLFYKNQYFRMVLELIKKRKYV